MHQGSIFINLHRVIVMHRILLFVLVGCLLASCQKDAPIPEKTYELQIPAGFPEPKIPDDNQLTEARVRLGRKIFYDPILSSDISISCASCHAQLIAFSDDKAFSIGVNGKTGLRNAPTLTNVGYSTSFFRDGGAPSLRHQAIFPISDSTEMNLSLAEAIERLNEHPEYPQLFKEAYGETNNPPLTRALEAFQFTLISGNSAFDKYYYQGDNDALTASQKRGWILFNSNELKCISCHSGFNFSNDNFENNGLYETYADIGRARVTSLSIDEGKFKVSTLRNIGLTAPYMHDGSLGTLEEVIEHYASGGSSHPNKSSFINGFELTNTEKTDLINFLHSLTDWEFITNPEFKE